MQTQIFRTGIGVTPNTGFSTGSDIPDDLTLVPQSQHPGPFSQSMRRR